MKLSRIVITLILVAIAGVVVSAPGVYAYPVSAGEWINFYKVYNDGFSGGPFNVYKSGSTSSLFETFCVETNEYFNPGVYYKIDSISDKAVLGGAPPSPIPDPLDPRTGYLYYNWVNKSLTTTFIYNNAANERSLQKAIWFIEQEYGNNDWSNPGVMVDPLATSLFNEANTSAGNSLWGVAVLNMVDSSGNRKQDMLVVPEPGILILLGIAMSAIGAASWRLRKL